MNTRLRLFEPDESCVQLRNSLLNYGLPDLAIINLADRKVSKDFVEGLERLIRAFEPRFKSVNVHYLENKEAPDRVVRFRIEATLSSDPMPEVIVFDSVLEPVSRTVTVENIAHG